MREETMDRYLRRLRLILKKQIASPPAPLAADDILIAQIAAAAALLEEVAGTETALSVLGTIARGLEDT